MTKHAGGLLDSGNALTRENDGSGLNPKPGNWSSLESVEGYFFVFSLFSKALHESLPLLARLAKGSLNTKVFIMAVESGLVRGHL